MLHIFMKHKMATKFMNNKKNVHAKSCLLSKYNLHVCIHVYIFMYTYLQMSFLSGRETKGARKRREPKSWGLDFKYCITFKYLVVAFELLCFRPWKDHKIYFRHSPQSARLKSWSWLKVHCSPFFALSLVGLCLECTSTALGPNFFGFQLIIFDIIGTSCFDISPNTYVNIVSCSPPEPEDGPIEERHNEDKRPDGDVDEKSSRAPERSKELNSSGTQWPKKVGQVVPDDDYFS